MIHTERAIGLLKSRSTIIHGLLINLIKSQRDKAENHKVTSIDTTVHVCTALINMIGGIIYSDNALKNVSGRLLTFLL